MRATGYRLGKPFELELVHIGDGLFLARPAALDYRELCAAALADGIKLKCNSAFREHEKQQRLYASYLAHRTHRATTEGAKKVFRALAADNGVAELYAHMLTVTPAQLPQKAPAARPGYSNHQAGTTVDLNRASGDDLKTPAPDSPTDLWLATNAAKYGFKRTVPSEPWHWEHFPLGVANA